MDAPLMSTDNSAETSESTEKPKTGEASAKSRGGSRGGNPSKQPNLVEMLQELGIMGTLKTLVPQLNALEQETLAKNAEQAEVDAEQKEKMEAEAVTAKSEEKAEESSHLDAFRDAFKDALASGDQSAKETYAEDSSYMETMSAKQEEASAELGTASATLSSVEIQNPQIFTVETPAVMAEYANKTEPASAPLQEGVSMPSDISPRYQPAGEAYDPPVGGSQVTTSDGSPVLTGSGGYLMAGDANPSNEAQATASGYAERMTALFEDSFRSQGQTEGMAQESAQAIVSALTPDTSRSVQENVEATLANNPDAVLIYGEGVAEVVESPADLSVEKMDAMQEMAGGDIQVIALQDLNASAEASNSAEIDQLRDTLPSMEFSPELAFLSGTWDGESFVGVSTADKDMALSEEMNSLTANLLSIQNDQGESVLSEAQAGQMAFTMLKLEEQGIDPTIQITNSSASLAYTDEQGNSYSKGWGSYDSQEATNSESIQVKSSEVLDATFEDTRKKESMEKDREDPQEKAEKQEEKEMVMSME